MVGTKALVVGADAEPVTVLAALRIHPSRCVHVLTTPREREEARALMLILEEQVIASRLWVIHVDTTEDFFAIASQIICEEPDAGVLVAGVHQAALLSAAYVHGVRALHGQSGKVRELPVLPFDYGSQLSDAKLAILTAVRDKPAQLQEVIKVTRLKANALSYHLHGGQGRPGLFSMAVVSQDDKNRLTLTTKGKAIVRGLEHLPRRRPKSA